MPLLMNDKPFTAAPKGTKTRYIAHKAVFRKKSEYYKYSDVL